MALTSGQKEILSRNIDKSTPYNIEDYTVCFNCKTPNLKEEDKYCPNCRFPQHGSGKEQKAFFSYLERKKLYLANQQKSVNKAKAVLFILGGLNILIGVAMYSMNFLMMADMFANIAVGIIYLVLGWWSQQKPFPAILTGFFLYLTMIAINAIIDPATIIQGIIFKIIFISALVYGYKAVKEVENSKAQLAKMSNTIGAND